MRSIIAALGLLLCATSGFAQEAEEPAAWEENANKEVSPAPKEDVLVPKSDRDDSADPDEFGEGEKPLYKPLSEIRATKRFGVSFRFGLFVSPVMGPGFEFFYQLNPNAQMGLAYFRGAEDFKNRLSATDGTTTEKNELSSSLSLIFGRYFVGDSFYVTGALGQRTVKTDYEIRSTTQNSTISAENTSLSTVVNVALGNLWSWENGYNAGIDWVGYSQPLSSKEDVNSKTGGSQVPPAELNKKRKEVEDLFKDISKLGTWQFLTFHIGYVF